VRYEPQDPEENKEIPYPRVVVGNVMPYLLWVVTPDQHQQDDKAIQPNHDAEDDIGVEHPPNLVKTFRLREKHNSRVYREEQPNCDQAGTDMSHRHPFFVYPCSGRFYSVEVLLGDRPTGSCFSTNCIINYVT
jgi:hypothetical protein